MIIHVFNNCWPNSKTKLKLLWEQGAPPGISGTLHSLCILRIGEDQLCVMMLNTRQVFNIITLDLDQRLRHPHLHNVRTWEHVSGYRNISVVLLSMEGMRALRFKQNHHNLCSDDERRFYGFGIIFGWTNPLTDRHKCMLCGFFFYSKPVMSGPSTSLRLWKMEIWIV